MTRLRAVAGPVRVLLIAFGLSPFLSALARDLPVAGALSRVTDPWFSFQCQRDASRALSALPGLPVCGRCLGIYLGLGLGAALLRPRLTVAKLRLWVAAAALLMGLDVLTEFFGLRPPLPWLRFATGFALAYPVGAALVSSIRSRAAAPESRA